MSVCAFCLTEESDCQILVRSKTKACICERCIVVAMKAAIDQGLEIESEGKEETFKEAINRLQKKLLKGIDKALGG